ncbi:sialidase family protein [Blastopirellula marina]|uniref:Sialidase n=1 Tax=Blastopirellula marina TaxID=124 RepID=A0A2S8GMK7_9BACT|nr:sialidase family protein [Blastopirellula marina]PQO45663.1 sialidase [Blastopirellula marina]
MNLTGTLGGLFAIAACLLAYPPYGHAADAPASKLPKVVGNDTPAFVTSELIFPIDDRPTKNSHASTIVETPEGLVAAWFGGTHENNPDVGIWVSRNTGNGWSPPVEVANGEGTDEVRHPCWNPVLFQPQAGPLMLFYKVGPSPSRWWGMLMTSTDNGITWSEPKRLGESEAIGHLLGPVKNKPIQLEDGTIVCPSSTEHKGWRVHFEVTKDLGETWEVIGPINDAKLFNAIQPSILTYEDGKQQILCRTRENVVATAWSTDAGKTWSALSPTELPNPNSGTDAVTLKDGMQLLVYNHTVKESEFPAGRNMLNVAISQDGNAWYPVLTLERQPGEYSYPAVIQTADGKVHITYTFRRETIKHVVLDPSRLKIPSPPPAK